MLYLSLLVLDPGTTRARTDLRNPYGLHNTLSCAFGKDRARYREARCLFRVADRAEGPRVIVQSRVRPDWSSLVMGISGYLAHEAAVKELRPVFQGGQRLRFLLLANPTRREPARNAIHPETGKPKDGPRRALVFDDWAETEAACREWLARKGERGGFRPLTFEVEDRGVVTVARGGKQIPYAAIRFEGFLQVTDPGQFLDTLSGGIGSGKGFGFGLLSLAPARQARHGHAGVGAG